MLALKCAVLISVLYPQAVGANNFKSSAVLEWDQSSQDAMFRTSVTMVGIVATQTGEHNHLAECIDRETASGGEADRNDRIRAAMKRFPSHHPQAVILAVIEKACGKF